MNVRHGILMTIFQTMTIPTMFSNVRIVRVKRIVTKMVKNNINKVKQIQDFFPPFIIVLIFLLHVPTASNENWWTTYCTDDDFENIDHSGKLMLLFSILDECSICGDKLLVFFTKSIYFRFDREILSYDYRKHKKSKSISST